MSKETLAAFGPILRRLRRERELTQERLSELVGVASPYICMLESGRKCPNLDMLFRLAEALDVRPGAIVDAMQAEASPEGKPPFLC